MLAPAGARISSRARGFVAAAIALVVAICGAVAVRGHLQHAVAVSYQGSAAGRHLSQPIVDMAATASGNGYWLVGRGGAVYRFGDAKYRGSTAKVALKQPIVGMAATHSGAGYWLVARDGGIFSFGDAKYRGSTGNIALKQPIVGMAATPSGLGYWLVARDGGIFSFGDAKFRGSTGSLVLAEPIVGMAATPTGRGYWLVASDGGIFSFGDAKFYGSTGNIPLKQPIVGMARTRDAHGYWLVAADGGIFAFGNARFFGSAKRGLAGQRAVDVVAAPDGSGYWIASSGGAVSTATPKGVRVDPTISGGTSPADRVANELVTRINMERRARGLHTVALDPMLHSYATKWARHLAAQGFLDHQDLMTILRASNGRFQQASENLALTAGVGATDAGTAHDALMHSDVHRPNILLPEARYVGVGAACVNGALYVVEDFATPFGITLQSHPAPPLMPIASSGLGGASC